MSIDEETEQESQPIHGLNLADPLGIKFKDRLINVSPLVVITCTVLSLVVNGHFKDYGF